MWYNGINHNDKISTGRHGSYIPHFKLNINGIFVKIKKNTNMAKDNTHAWFIARYPYPDSAAPDEKTSWAFPWAARDGSVLLGSCGAPPRFVKGLNHHLCQLSVHNLDLLIILVYIIECDIVYTVPLDLFPGHPLTVNKLHGIVLVHIECIFFILVVNAVP